MYFKNKFQWCHLIYFCTTILISAISINASKNKTAHGNTKSNLSAGNVNKSVSKSRFDYRVNSTEATRPHYALNPFSTHRLALREEKLVQNLTQIINNTSNLLVNGQCKVSLDNYLRGFHKDIKSKIKSHKRALVVAENPILTFRMIRRIFVDLQNDTKSACQNSHPEVVGAIENAFSGNMTPVTLDDLDDALLGLLRIQYIYGFNATNETRLGIFNGVETGATLSHEDCLALANKAIEIEAYQLAYQWLVSASLSAPLKDTKLHYTQNGSCMVVESETDKTSCTNSNDESEYSRLWVKLLNSANIQNVSTLHENLDKRQMKMKGKFYRCSKYATCRGENQQSIETRSKLFCSYTMDSDPYFHINPIKTEMLSRDPPILQFHELIGEETIQLISNLTYKYMLRSAVVNRTKPQAEFDNFRTSVNGWLRDTGNNRADKRLVALNRKVEKLTGLEVVKKLASNCQVVWYGSLGGHYDFHDDSLQGSSYSSKQGDRIATLLYFFSNVKMGGYTAFPKVGIYAKPLKGSAILWYNLYRNGTKDTRLQHGGCPVILGTKHVANRWIYESENIWKHPCLLDPMA